MSEIRDILADSVNDRMTYTGETFTNLRTNRTFVAEYQESPPLELRVEMGIDPRESGQIYVLPAAAASIIAGDFITAKFFGNTAKFQVLAGTREQNPGNVQVKFGVQLITAKDAQ